jgi:uncharacterized membrane protein
MVVLSPAWVAARWVAFLYATAGVVASSVFFYIQRNYIHAFCVYCMISAALTVFLFVTSWLHASAAKFERAELTASL